MRAALCLLLLSCILPLCAGIKFEVTAYSKCIGQELGEGTLAVGTYSVVQGHEPEIPRVTAKITSPYGTQLHWQENVQEGQFGFTTNEAGQYMACFWLPHGSHVHSAQVDLDLKTGVGAQDWKSIAKKEKLEGVALELRKLDEAVRNIRNEMAYFRKREADMRDLNEATNSRVAWLSIVSLFVCVGLAALQLWYLKTYFERKKVL